jgi:biofilm protein TabA
MAIFGKISDIRNQLNNRELDVVFEYLEKAITNNTEINSRIRSMGLDQYKKIKITDDIFAIEQSYNARRSEKPLFESHTKYIDFQFLISGQEVVRLACTDLLKIDSKYDEEGDFTLYKNYLNSENIEIKKGDLSIFFTKDGHMPGQQKNNKLFSRVFKVVVKVPIIKMNNK